MKYKLTDETIVRNGVTLRRIEALNDFRDVKKGEKGGFVESADNLSINDNAWVSGNAVVSGNALVSGNAVVYGNAWVSGNAVVYGNALVSGNAVVSGNAWVSGNAVVYGEAQVSGEAHVSGEAQVSGEAHVSGEVQVISIPFLSKYKITVTDNHIKIDCKQHTIEQWMLFTDDEIAVMDDGALDWWKKHKDFIFIAIELRN